MDIFVVFLQGIQEDMNNNLYAECVKKCDTALTLDKDTERIVRDLNSKLCLCLSKSDGSRGVKVCSALLELEPQNADFLINRAESYIANEQYEEGAFQSIKPQTSNQSVEQESKTQNNQPINQSMHSVKRSFTANSFLCSRHRLSRGSQTRWWKSAGTWRLGEGEKTAQTVPEEGLLQDSRC